MNLDKSPDTIKIMFDSIAQNYDFMNDIMTGGTHRYTRKFMCNLITFNKRKIILDLATGTGDNIIYLKKNFPNTFIYGLDLSKNMLQIAVRRIKKKKLFSNVKLIEGDISKSPFESNFFDLCTISYGIRNVLDIRTALSEINRVTKKGGCLIVVEATNPTNKYLNKLITFHFRFISPKLARIVSSNYFAYNYLSKSIRAFPNTKNFVKLMRESNWKKIKHYSLFFGSVTIYQGFK
ncbi:MAG: Ubiquinone/menaquinone biosynthesis C-methyltransferase UbiE [Candidatus Heimdallarchaeota archaeon LC_3]|nr:MAG: Ubiquinone/menaquinone biosynthesis C-methyltransferase UbiE [Candidatus Heimdallarchaeota archaeon LC_3]